MPDTQFPSQKQHRQPGIESQMHPKPQAEDFAYKSSDKLAGKIALITR